MADHYKFGDVVEWETTRGRYARWMIVCHAPIGGETEKRYAGVWMGDATPPKESERTGMGFPVVEYGPPYLVKTDD